jgi:hypothetical protein
LAASAQKYIDQCTSTSGTLVDHNPNRSLNFSTYIGENIYASSGNIGNVSLSVQSWWNENQFFNFDSNSCQNGQVCGHYTQVVWASSVRLGCSRQFCSSLTFKYNILCDYGPGGNYAAQQPYVKADANLSGLSTILFLLIALFWI